MIVYGVLVFLNMRFLDEGVLKKCNLSVSSLAVFIFVTRI